MDIIREAGFYIYGVIVFGMLSARYAISFARTRDAEARFRWLCLVGLTLAVGVLGSVAGLQAAAKYSAAAPDKWLVIVGLREALHNLGMALCFTILDLLLLLFVPRRSSTLPAKLEQVVHS
jgi:membrane-bound metal-dependent hydrolase YbcI (DUF457 family)